MLPQQRSNNPSAAPNSSPPVVTKRKRRVGGMAWILIGITLLFAVGGALTALRKNVAPPPAAPKVPQSFLGMNELKDAPGGVTFWQVWPPDSPADKAGLLGGDIITAFDNHATVDLNTMNDLLWQTPPGKTVEVIYIRDGEQKKTRLTTISRSDVQHLESVFRNRGEGDGALGFIDTELVPISGSNIQGVRLNDLSPSGPAALAGIQEGDIIIEFDGVPIRSRGEFLARVRRAVPYSTVKIVLMRGAQQLELQVKMGKRG